WPDAATASNPGVDQLHPAAGKIVDVSRRGSGAARLGDRGDPRVGFGNCRRAWRRLAAMSANARAAALSKGKIPPASASRYRLRDVPIITFVNKLDREGLDSFDLLEEIERDLAFDVTPASWPIGMGRGFLRIYDLSKAAHWIRSLKCEVPHPLRQEANA